MIQFFNFLKTKDIKPVDLSVYSELSVKNIWSKENTNEKF